MDLERRGFLRLALGAAVAAPLASCGLGNSMKNQRGEGFDGFHQGEEAIILFASANRIEVCGEGVDILQDSAPQLLKNRRVSVFMPDVENTQDHRTLNVFKPFLDHPNFDLITGSNRDIDAFAKEHNAEYVFWSDHKNSEVLAHTPNPLMLLSNQRVASVIPVRPDETAQDFIAKIDRQMAATYEYDDLRHR